MLLHKSSGTCTKAKSGEFTRAQRGHLATYTSLTCASLGNSDIRSRIGEKGGPHCGVLRNAMDDELNDLADLLALVIPSAGKAWPARVLSISDAPIG